MNKITARDISNRDVATIINLHASALQQELLGAVWTIAAICAAGFKMSPWAVVVAGVFAIYNIFAMFKSTASLEAIVEAVNKEGEKQDAGKSGQ